MNIMLLSVAPFAPTGYGTQTAQLSERLVKAGHKVAVSCTAGLQWAEMDWNDVHLYPADTTRMNKRMLKHHVADWSAKCGGPVQVISLFDIWPWVDTAYGGMLADFEGLDIAAWLPLDSYPLAPKIRFALERYHVTPIAMSAFGQTTLEEQGYQDVLYVPHAINTDLYQPVEDREHCRRQLGLADEFVIGMVAHNEGIQPSRKAFPAVMQAFAAFRAAHDDAVLYLHTDVTGTAFGGLNLLGVAEMFGIPPGAIVPVNQTLYLQGLPVEAMPIVYSALDVLANPSYGEGFGLPIIEAQACGTPVVVSAWSAMPELVGSGWTVGGQPWYNEASGSFWWHADWSEILAAFEAAYEKRGDQSFRDEAREFALDYDADKVFNEQWVPTLERLGKPREVPPLKPVGGNRAMRRAAKKAGQEQVAA